MDSHTVCTGGDTQTSLQRKTSWISWPRPDDIRCQLLDQVYNGQEIEQNIRYWLMKYPGTSYGVPSVENNYMVFRLSEVYLIAAEAGLKAGGEYRSPALSYLNDIVSRATRINLSAMLNLHWTGS